MKSLPQCSFLVLWRVAPIAIIDKVYTATYCTGVCDIAPLYLYIIKFKTENKLPKFYGTSISL